MQQWKPRSLILDLFGDYLRYGGDSVRLGQISELLGVFGIDAPIVRVNLSRLRREGWFTTHREGRETAYSLTPHLREILDEGRERIFHRHDEPWEGRWTMVIYQVPESDRAARDQLRKQLAWHGFGQLSPSTWLSPHDLRREAKEIAASLPAAKIDILWCGTDDLSEDRDLAARCWDLNQLGDDYTSFIQHYIPMDDPEVNATKDGRQALIERMQLIGDYRRFPFRDPNLPTELEPTDWPSAEAHRLFTDVHTQLGGPATEYVESVVGRSLSDM
jgi:phenylacetic acid degradation operon negative regulatory protein